MSSRLLWRYLERIKQASPWLVHVHILHCQQQEAQESGAGARRRGTRLIQAEQEQPQELNQNMLIQGTQCQLHQQGNRVQATPPLQQQQLPTPAIPLVLNVAMIQNFGRPPVAAMPGIHSYPAQPGWPGAQGRPFTPHFRAPQCMGPPFIPFPPQPLFCPR